MSGRSTADPSLPILPDLASIAKETHLIVRESSRIDAAPFFRSSLRAVASGLTQRDCDGTVAENRKIHQQPGDPRPLLKD